MDKSCLQYSLTEEERRTFDETGYLILKNILSEDQVAELTKEVDAIYEEKLNLGHDPKKRCSILTLYRIISCFLIWLTMRRCCQRYGEF